MLGFAGLISVMIGGAIAYVAERFPAHVEVLQTVGGVLLIVGFGLVGWALPADDLRNPGRAQHRGSTGTATCSGLPLSVCQERDEIGLLGFAPD